MTFNTILVIGTIVNIFAYLPQIYQLIKTKSAADLNLKAWGLWVIGLGCVEAYAINLYIHYPKSYMLLVYSSLSFSLIVISTALIILYKIKELNSG